MNATSTRYVVVEAGGTQVVGHVGLLSARPGDSGDTRNAISILSVRGVG